MLDDHGNVEELARLLGYAPPDLVEELLDLARARASLLLRAADFASTEQVHAYLTRLLDRPPTADEVKLSQRARRRLRITEDQRVELERTQYDRCRLCGRFLDESANPHVDHIRPLAQGGEDALDNLQLLCDRCNLGKHDLSAWLLGVPYQAEDRSSRRLRYVVLARAGGKCSEDGCELTTRHAEMELISRVPLSEGGRWVFDNLRVVCSEHAARLHRERERGTRRAMTPQRSRRRRIVS